MRHKHRHQFPGHCRTKNCNGRVSIRSHTRYCKRCAKQRRGVSVSRRSLDIARVLKQAR